MMKLIVINFHYIRKDFSSPYPSIFGRTPDQFQRQLEILSSLGTFISQDDIKAFLNHGKHLPEKAFLVTFDDGLKEQYDLAFPILKRMGIPAIFFPNTLPLEQPCVLNVHKSHLIRSVSPTGELIAFLKKATKKDGVIFSKEKLTAGAAATYRYDHHEQRELKYLLNFLLDFRQREKYINAIFNQLFENQEHTIHSQLYMTPKQIKSLSNEGMLGCHGRSHHPLGDLANQDQENEILTSKTYLKRLTRNTVDAFSYPYGSYDAVHGAEAAVKKAGFLFAFTMERAINDTSRFPFFLSRFDTNDLPGGKLFNQDPTSIFDALPSRTWGTHPAD